ncbi:hypothetical protein PG996_002642 [Apiospora saccharicola]|uniref:RRM domain-containing protein n=1 Tax=Apiospora saccharicola TaxID=335842 RepID=A0ABR1WK11_9PEZI
MASDQQPSSTPTNVGGDQQIELATMLYVSNLPAMARESDVRDAFAQFGPVTRVSMSLFVGGALVTFASPADAAEAIRRTDGLYLRVDQPGSRGGGGFEYPPLPEGEGEEGGDAPEEEDEDPCWVSPRPLRVGIAGPEWTEEGLREHSRRIEMQARRARAAGAARRAVGGEPLDRCLRAVQAARLAALAAQVHHHEADGRDSE